jgi:3D (Asp-Asp-Asp) domain-containing protein
MSVDQRENVLKQASIFLTVFLLLFGTFSSVAYAQKDSKAPKKHRVSIEKKNTPPKGKIAQSNAIKVLVSAYYKPERGQGDYATGSYKGDMRRNGGKKTFTGKVPQIGMVAVDPRVIPLGTQMYIPMFNLYVTAEDTGGDIKGHRMDIFTGNGDWGLKKAMEIGNKMAEVIIIKKAS